MNANKKSIMSDLKKLDEIKDEDIDYSDIPPLDDSFFTKVTVDFPKPKKSVTLRIDDEVLAWFKAQGKGYQTKMNEVLRKFVIANKEHARHHRKKTA
ncbi:MAG: BrnA antitoxin family protein [Legionellales bacterium]|nr:BrnA antitoxin family protein [Legionellales bacterium]